MFPFAFLLVVFCFLVYIAVYFFKQRKWLNAGLATYLSTVIVYIVGVKSLTLAMVFLTNLGIALVILGMLYCLIKWAARP